MTTPREDLRPPDPGAAGCDASCSDAGSGNAEWVAELWDTYRAGDIESTIASLEGLLGRLRAAGKARRILARLPTDTLRAALALRDERSRSGSCR